MAAAGISIATLLRMSGAGAADDDFSLELYGRYAARLFRYCRRLTPDADAAEDAVQATVLDAARLLRAGFRPEFEAAWLFELAQRHAAEGASRPRRRAVAALPDELRKPLELRLEGRPYTEIAEALGVARGTIELRVLRARSAAQPRRASRLGDLTSLGGALKALLAGGAAVPATVAAVGALAVLPRVVRHDSLPARPTPAVVAPKVEPAAPTAAAVVRSPRRSVAAHPGRTAPPARRQAPERARPAAATPVAATAPSAPVAAAPSASAPPASPSPSAPSSSAPSPEAVPRPAPAPTSASEPVPAAAPTPVPAPSPQPVAPATSTPALEPVAVPPVASDPVAATTAVVDQVAGTVPALPAVPPVPAPAPVPTLP
ncbi:MAG TPA: sigma-70 family RNA polymerase sigma factor [Gaiellaceae bacterium]